MTDGLELTGDLLFRTRLPDQCFACRERFTDARIYAQVTYTRDGEYRDVSWRFWHADCDDRAKELRGDD